MKQAVIVSTARTGLAKSYRGAFNETHGATMAGHAIEHAVKRSKVDPALIEDAFIPEEYPETLGARLSYAAALRLQSRIKPLTSLILGPGESIDIPPK